MENLIDSLVEQVWKSLGGETTKNSSKLVEKAKEIVSDNTIGIEYLDIGDVETILDKVYRVTVWTEEYMIFTNEDDGENFKYNHIEI